MFQSPSGVLGVCRHEGKLVQTDASMFQSPSGVLGVCRHDFVTYPAVKGLRKVSVPFRGFRGLQDYVWRDIQANQVGFQSPSGVLGVCRSCR